jgi:hypothetical protein
MPLNPKQFKDFVDATVANGGATMRVDTGELVGNNPEGPHGYIVGGEPHRANPNARVATRKIPSKKFNVETARSAANELISDAAPGDNLSVGSWLDTTEGKSQVELDASRTHPTLKGAMNVARSRKEKAVWSTKLQDEIRTDEYFANPKKYHDMVGEPL